MQLSTLSREFVEFFVGSYSLEILCGQERHMTVSPRTCLSIF